ncbi:DegT/DnrJ/EryC1/StrS family aminotransferase [Desulfotalea psychrophila]|uniref:Related to aminotransferase n=1 Tax=Desulfotalea psychrophila (strain LSv54 / DSM 12343) TaxID=177439 RepID=Q6ALV5_DESPS|nr:DegT/DnrJ/EryC1/StrS family aminotransferase [Desulfotalea psychrophila]CAG36670.1 related to aminotransferase [Desulfotalea psychrophila LSv54]
MPGFEVFGEEEKQQVNEVLDSGVLFRYEFKDQRKGVYKVKEFENKFASYANSTHGQAVTSGSAALKVALMGLGVGPGDEVITQGFTFVATWEAILEIGATPVFTEVDETMNMDPADLKKKITAKTKCIIPVHMLGAPARIEEIVAIAKAKNIFVLEDSAQAPGARINGKHVGSFGDCGTFSFDSVKTITTGEGGMIITDNADLWRTMSEYHDHGHDHLDNPGGRGGDKRRFIGSNYRMMEIQGAIGLAQLGKLDYIVSQHQKHKAILKEAASAIPGVSFRHIMDEKGDSASFFSFFLQDKEHSSRVNEVLRAEGCGAINFAENTWHFYPKWEHLLGAKTCTASGWPFVGGENRKRFVYDPAALPQSADLIGRCLVYPIAVKTDEAKLAQMCTALKKAAQV